MNQWLIESAPVVKKNKEKEKQQNGNFNFCNERNQLVNFE